HVHRVERREVVDIGEEAGCLHDVGEGAARGVEHGRQIPEGLGGLRLDTVGELTRRRIRAQLAGAEHEIVRGDRLAVRAAGWWRSIRADGSAAHADLLDGWLSMTVAT